MTGIISVILFLVIIGLINLNRKSEQLERRLENVEKNSGGEAKISPRAK